MPAPFRTRCRSALRPRRRTAALVYPCESRSAGPVPPASRSGACSCLTSRTVVRPHRRGPTTVRSLMAAIDRRLAEQYPAEEKERKSQLVPLHEWLVGDVRSALDRKSTRLNSSHEW